ncbi:TPA: hypothetical protein ACGQ50_000789 [Enterobacter cloacae]
MKLLRLILNLFRRKKSRARIYAPPKGEAKTGFVKTSTPQIPPISRAHVPGAKVDPALFKDARMPERELPHSDPRSPFHRYWLESDGSGDMAAATVAGFGVGMAAQTFFDNEPSSAIEVPAYDSTPDTQTITSDVGKCDFEEHSRADTGSYGEQSGFQCDLSGGDYGSGIGD